MNINIQEESYEFRKMLAPDEELLWTGVPGRGIVFGMFDIYMIPFSLLWCGFAIFWEITAITMGAPFFFALFGLPFVAAGLYLVFGRFIADIRRRKNTIYALTNKRIFIRSGKNAQTFKTIELKTISEVVLKLKANGTGSLYFSAHGSPHSLLTSSAFIPGITSLPAFELIEDVQEVYNKIMAIR